MRNPLRYFAKADAPSGTVGSDSQSPAGEFSDVNAAWRDPRLRYVLINEMRMSDPIIRGLLQQVKLPILGASWDTVPPDHDQAELVDAGIRWNFGLQEGEGQMVQSWAEQVRQALLLLEFGSMWEEIVWAEDLAELDGVGPRKATQNGRRPQLRPIVRVAPRFPATIDKIKLDPATGLPAAAHQALSIPNQPKDGIPGERLCWYVFDQEGTDYRGTSLLRPMWGAFRSKRSLMTASNIAWDRYAVKTPKIRWPLGGGKKAQDEAKRIGRSLKSDPRSSVELEGPPPPIGGWDVELMGDTPSEPVDMLRHYDQQMASACLAQFSQLGTSETGNRAVSVTLADTFYLGVVALAKQLAVDFHRRKVRRFVDVNFGEEVPASRITVSKISARAVSDVVNAVAVMAGSGYRVVSDDIRDNVLDLLDLPHPKAGQGAPEGAAVTPSGAAAAGPTNGAVRPRLVIPRPRA